MPLAIRSLHALQREVPRLGRIIVVWHDSKADLRGKKIGFTAGTGSEVYTATLLKAAGLTAADVTLVNLRPQEMLPAMAAGSIDAFDSWEPHIANARKTRGARLTCAA